MSAKKAAGSGFAPSNEGKKSATRATAVDVKAALRLRYPNGAFGFFEEVGNATGAGVARHADAVAVGLWPSRGLLIEGIEIKVSRSDWLSELKNPKKADAIAKYCDRWWLAAGDESIVQPGELPANWGLLVLKGDKMVCKTEAPKLEPEALTRSFVAALLRRASEGLDRSIAVAKREGIELGEKRGPEEHVAKLANTQRALEMLQSNLDEFEKLSGLKINSWDAGNIGKAVDDLMKVRRFGHKADPIAELEQAADRIERQSKSAAETLRQEAKVLKSAAAALGLVEMEAAQ